MIPLERVAAIVLAGGESRRMGRPKAALPFLGESLLGRIVRIVSGVVPRVVVVRAPGQALPPLPDGVAVAEDAVGGRGPLEGFRAGVLAAAGAEAVFLCATDAPLLQAEFVRLVCGALGAHDAAVPVIEGVPQPLAGVYRASVLATVERLLAGGERSLQALLAAVDARRLDEAELRAVDPELLSLRNVNTPDDYHTALDRAAVR